MGYRLFFTHALATLLLTCLDCVTIPYTTAQDTKEVFANTVFTYGLQGVPNWWSLIHFTSKGSLDVLTSTNAKMVLHAGSTDIAMLVDSCRKDIKCKLASIAQLKWIKQTSKKIKYLT